jgi:hypothetical protein
MPDDHSELVPLLPIPNRTVKRLCADDSAGSRVKVGHRQAIIEKARPLPSSRGALSFEWCAPLLDFVALQKVDTRSKTVVYCEASLITELL